MTDIKMLPLPEWAACDETVADMSTTDVREAMADYARANMEPLKAEIEALRAERDSFQRVGIRERERAERLAEVLREAQPFIGWVGSYEELHKKIDAALRDHDQEGKDG